MCIVTLSVPIPPGMVLNANQRLHWGEKARSTAYVRDEFAAAWARIRDDSPRMGRAHCLALIAWPDRRRRDPANLYPTIKAAVDGVVTGPSSKLARLGWDGLLPDDDHAHLDGPDPRAADPIRGLNGIILTLIFNSKEA